MKKIVCGRSSLIVPEKFERDIKKLIDDHNDWEPEQVSLAIDTDMHEVIYCIIWKKK